MNREWAWSAVPSQGKARIRVVPNSRKCFGHKELSVEKAV
jgi:hypothetical protein